MKAKPLILLLAVLCACNRQPHDPADEFLTLNKNSLHFTPTIKIDTLKVDASSPWKLSVEPSASWLSVTPAVGNPSATVIVRVTDDTSVDAGRTATLHFTLNSGSKTADVVVTQEATLNPDNLFLYGKPDSSCHFLSGAKDADGNLIVIGFTGPIEKERLQNDDFWVVKITPQGKMLWEKKYGGSLHDDLYDMTKTKNGEYILVGRTESLDGDLAGRATAAPGDADACAMKIDRNGKLLWIKWFGDTPYDEFSSVKMTSDGNYILSGSHDTGAIITQWIMKMDDNGNVLWEKTFGGTNYGYVGKAIATRDGGALFTGSGDTQSGTVADKPTATHDTWVVKMNDTGAVEWKKYLGGQGVEKAVGIWQLADGSYVATGYTQSRDLFPDLNGLANLYMLHLDENGNEISRKIIGKMGWEEPWDMLEEPNGNMLIVGEAGPASAEEKVHDAAIWEVTKDGDLVSAKYYGLPSDSDFATSLLQLADNQYAFFGITRSVFTDTAGDRQWGGWYFPFEVK
jgi:hypothetical protein